MPNLVDLPKELINEVCKYLSIRNLARFSRTNKQIREISKSRLDKELAIFQNLCNNFKKLMEDLGRATCLEESKKLRPQIELLIDENITHMVYLKKGTVSNIWVILSCLHSSKISDLETKYNDLIKNI